MKSLRAVSRNSSNEQNCGLNRLPSVSLIGSTGIASGFAAASPASIAPESHKAFHHVFVGAKGFSAEGI